MASTAIARRARRARERDWPPLPAPEHRPLHRAVLAALGPVRGARLLDVDCGVGLFLRSAEARGAVVAGVDAADELLEIARWALPDADLRVGDAESLPFADGAFDVVSACTAVPHGLPGRAAVLAELARVVRPGGRIAVGGWVRRAGCWDRELDARLRALTASEAPATEPEGRGSAPGPRQAPGPGHPAGDPLGEAGLVAGLRAAGLVVRARGEVGCPAVYPSRAAAWAAMLGSEQLMRAIRLAGERAVREAFRTTVAPRVADDGSVHLSKAFCYAVATVPDGLRHPG